MRPLVRTLRKAVSFLCVILLVETLFSVGSYGEEDQKGKTIQLKTGLYYTIQKGDTLWDISEHFFDSAYDWPDMWQKNEYIRNPHWIYPGNRLKLYDKIDIGRLPVPAPIPKKERPREFIAYDSIDRVGFIRREAVRGSGEIFSSVRHSSVKHKGLLSTGDTVYIHSYDGAKFKAGDKFTVFRTFESLEHPLRGEPVGIQHLILGIVVITEVLPDMIVGNIVESYSEIDHGEFLMPYEKQSPKIELTESVLDLEGTIISADDQDRGRMLCEGMLAFIDKGEDDGIKTGQSYDIYVQKEETFYGEDDKKHVLPPPVVIGNMLILHIEKTTATALITKSTRDILIGEKVHAGPSPTRKAVE